MPGGAVGRTTPSVSRDTGPVTSWQPTSRTAWWRILLAAVLGVLLSATTASVGTLTTAQTRVGAIPITTAAAVGFDQGVWASRHQVNGPPQTETAVGRGVAAETGAANTTARGWKVGDPIENLTKAGNAPA